MVDRFARWPVLARQKAGPTVGGWKAAIEIPPFCSGMRDVRAWPLNILLVPQPLGRDARHFALAAARAARELVPDLVTGRKIKTRKAQLPCNRGNNLPVGP